MRLLTHNMLMCSKKSCSRGNGTTNFPLQIKATKMERQESEFNKEFIVHMLPKLDWPALVKAATELSMSIPTQLPPNAATDEALLRNLHTLLLDIHIEEGELTCPACERKYPIKDGIPNMLLREDEV